MLEIAFTIKNETGDIVAVQTNIEEAIEPVTQICENGETIVHFKPPSGHVCIVIKSLKESAE